MPEHTPGRWSIGGIDHHGFAEIHGTGFRTLAKVAVQGTNGRPLPQGEANANMIVVVPEMLEVLRQAMHGLYEAAQLIRPLYPEQANIFRDDAERCHALIARAEGRSNSPF